MNIDYTSRKDWAERYIRRKKNGKIGWAEEDSYKAKEERINNFLARNPLPKKSRFLELGCGAGNITLLMAKKEFESHGIDIVPEAIRWAQEKMALSNSTADFRVGNIVDLNCYSDNYFDFIFDGETLHCVIDSDRKKCLSSIFRVLKQGGYFLAGANLVNTTFTASPDLDDESYFEPRTRCLYHKNVPYYYLSEEQEFLSEI
ncbi:MAG: class I SAM-dependent methyltransferase [Sedimentisphaerales bacterium]|nr:class I SAM-dependent methyltransferase [Sedimentisphaerales bacterium]